MPKGKKFRGLGHGDAKAGDSGSRMTQSPRAGEERSMDSKDLMRMPAGKLGDSSASKGATSSKVRRKGSK